MVTVFGLFFLSVIFNIHGYSVNEWAETLHTSEPFSLGSTRGVRSDDYLASLPVAFSQVKNDYKEINDSISLGQNLNISAYPVPVKNWTSLFRIESWGYFLGADLGMSWSWNIKIFGTLAVLLCFFYVCLPQVSLGTIFLGALFILYSPFFQYWSLYPVPFFMYSIAAALVLGMAMNSSSIKSVLIYSVFFVLFAFAFVLNIYPAIQLPSMYFSLMIFFFLTSPNVLIKKRNIIFGLGSLLVLLVLLIVFIFSNIEIITILENTVYPGKRFVNSGGGNWISLFKNNILSSKYFPRNGLFGGNISEASSFINISPLLLVYFLKFENLGKRWRFLLITTSLFLCFYLLWYFWGLPAWGARISGFSLIPLERSIYIVSFLNLITILFLLKHPLDLSTKVVRYLLIGWVLLHVHPIYLIGTNIKTHHYLMVFYFGATTSAVYFFLKSRSNIALTIILLCTIIQAYTFNPLTKGGFNHLFQSDEMKEIAKLIGPDRVIVHDDLVLGNLPRILGLKSFSGVHFYPQKELWKIMDSDNKYEEVWNRYAHIVWSIDEKMVRPVFSNPQADVLKIVVSPDDEVLKILGVRYVMAKKGSSLGASEHLKLILRTSCCTIFEIQ